MVAPFGHLGDDRFPETQSEGFSEMLRAPRGALQGYLAHKKRASLGPYGRTMLKALWYTSLGVAAVERTWNELASPGQSMGLA